MYPEPPPHPECCEEANSKEFATPIGAHGVCARPCVGHWVKQHLFAHRLGEHSMSKSNETCVARHGQ
eukprot:15069734-Alexandrium_andersonii.AAC.1